MALSLWCRPPFPTQPPPPSSSSGPPLESLFVADDDDDARSCDVVSRSGLHLLLLLPRFALPFPVTPLLFSLTGDTLRDEAILFGGGDSPGRGRRLLGRPRGQSLGRTLQQVQPVDAQQPRLRRRRIREAAIRGIPEE